MHCQATVKWFETFPHVQMFLRTPSFFSGHFKVYTMVSVKQLHQLVSGRRTSILIFSQTQNVCSLLSSGSITFYLLFRLPILLLHEISGTAIKQIANCRCHFQMKTLCIDFQQANVFVQCNRTVFWAEWCFIGKTTTNQMATIKQFMGCLDMFGSSFVLYVCISLEFL